jgi:phosphomannomutase
MASGDALMLSVSGLRGVVGSSLTPELATRFAAAVGAFLRSPDAPATARVAKGKRPLVVLSRDGRLGGDVIRDAACAGLRSTGCDVIDIAVAMTPTVGVATDLFRAHAALQITASHNPQQWNGMKVLLRTTPGRVSACAPSKALADKLIARFNTDAPVYVPWTDVGTVDDGFEQALVTHVQNVGQRLQDLGAIKPIQRLKARVLLDSVNASGRLGAPLLLDALKCQLTHLGADDSGIFPHVPEPTRDNLRSVATKARAAKAHVTFAQDPDADRLAILDERGRYIGEEYTLVLCTMALVELGLIGKGSLLAVNLSTSRMIEDVAARVGAKVLRTAVGEANVVDAMKANRCVLGGEGNGGVIWPDITYIRDSLGAMGLVLALMAHTKASISQLVATIPSYAIVKRKVDLPSKDRARTAVDALAKAFATQRVDRQDGVWIAFDDRRAWLHVRASNTEPIMRLIAEAPTASVANALLDEAAKVIG